MSNLRPLSQLLQYSLPDRLIRTWLGHPIRRITLPAQSPRVYLSFDDGPDPETTPQVLSLLKEFGAKATFFVVAERAEQHPKLLQRIMQEGHAIGNHSLDHRYSAFFKGYSVMHRWVADSEALLRKLGVTQNVGFRPPVGIRTPELARTLHELQLPLVLWQQRSFDGVRKFDISQAKKMVARSHDGDILLLHDKQRDAWRESFLISLGVLIESLRRRGFALPKLELNPTPAPLAP